MSLSPEIELSIKDTVARIALGDLERDLKKLELSRQFLSERVTLLDLAAKKARIALSNGNPAAAIEIIHFARNP